MAGLFDQLRRELHSPAPGPHPEADLLNSYMEGALTPPERAAVVDHLSHCASCREVVALVSPTTAPPPPPASLKDPAVRLALWRWVVVATTAVVVLAAVLVNNNRRGETEPPLPTIASTGTPQPAAPSSESVPRQPASSPAAAEAKHAPARQARQEEPSATKGLLAKDESQKKQALPAAPPPPFVQAPGQAANEVVAQAAPVPADRAEVDVMRRDQAAKVAQGTAGATPAAPPGNVPAFSAAVINSAPAPLMKAKSARAETAAEQFAPATRWTISSGGELEKSLDSGTTWQPVPVTGSVRFRAVAAIGADIWVGGAAAALYHSTDGGETWSRVQPRGLSGDVVRIDFHDPQHGELFTRAGGTCSTSDAGHSWTCR